MVTLFMSKAPVDEDALLELVDDDTEFLETLIDTFLADCSEYMESIRQAVDDEDARALVEEAHGLKGAVANLQAQSAQHAARRMEELGRSEDFEKASDAFEELQARVDRLQSALQEIVQDLE
jgi:HPt (histidine-containing phosphotransfer) domain-containing protein